MEFRTHLITSAAAGLALYPRRPLRAIALVAAGTLIDLDHLLLYAMQTGDWTVSGALHYDRYRHQRAQHGDTRPRYGPLRSLIHQPWLLLPILWTLAARRPALRPIALGLSLHLLLDYLNWPRDQQVLRRAGGRCQICGRARRRLHVGWRLDEGQWVGRAICRSCSARGL